MEPAVRLEHIEPDASVGRPVHARIAQQDQIGQTPAVAEAHTPGQVRRRGQKPAADDEQAIDLAGAQLGPGLLVQFGDIEDIVVVVLDPAEPFGGRAESRLIDHLAGEAHGLDARRDPFDEGADRARAGRDEAEDAGLGGAHGPLAGAMDHQARQFDQQIRLGSSGVEEGFARQGQDFGVAQGDHVRGVRGAGHHGHFADRLSGPDDADQLGRLIRLDVKHPQPARADQIEGVGRIARRKQPLAPGQGEPTGAIDHRSFEDARQGDGQGVGTKRSHGVLYGR